MKNREPQIVFKPIRRIIIHDDPQELTVEELLMGMGHGAEAGNFGRSLLWADGVAFAYSMLPWTDQTISDFLKGMTHVNSVVFARWPKFVEMVELANSKIRIPLWDNSSSPSMMAMAKWCKKFSKMKEEPKTVQDIQKQVDERLSTAFGVKSP